MTIPIIDDMNFMQTLDSQNSSFFAEYYAFYSSWLGGITTNPKWMLLPMDDHMVHRGDGVFEAMKAVNRSVYLMQEHMERLFNSAKQIALNTSFDMEYVSEIVLETLRVANQPQASIRIFLSRGPGNFSVNPYDSKEPQLYVIITKLNPPSLEKYTQGICIGQSQIPMKPSWMAQIKSCNYLPNVLMKKEAVDRGWDFVIGVDANQTITEGPTENILIVDAKKRLIHPPLTQILKGTTMVRACELGRQNGLKTEIKPISIEDLLSASEVLITGTSLNILPVVKFEDSIIGEGKPGPIAKQLNELMLADIELGNRGRSF